MANGGIRGAQIGDNTITRQQLALNLLNGTDFDVTAGAQDATFTGLREGTNPSDAVTFSQLESVLSQIEGTKSLRGSIVGDADLTGNATGNAYADSTAEYQNGDLFLVETSGDLVVSDGVVAVNAGDSICITRDTNDGAITVADVFVFDNTESPDLLRTSDVIDNLASNSTTDVLSANQGMLIDARLDSLEQEETEEFTVTTAGQTFTLANAPLVGLRNRRVYLNGIRLQASQFTITGSVLTITAPTVVSGDCVTVDYRF